MANARFGAPISVLGGPGPAGPVGPSGNPGKSLLSGNGAPSGDLGQVGDTYLDLAAGALYPPKTETGWPSSTRSLIGPEGPLGASGRDGAALLSGYGPPSDTAGSDGDSYFDGQAGAIWGPKAAGVWPSGFTSLIGPPGGQGDTGTLIYGASGSPDDAQGRDGDFFIDTLEGRLYGPKSAGSWGNALSLIGPEGARGPVGPQGLGGSDGATILVGSSTPSATQGKPGDVFMDVVASMIYGPRGGDGPGAWPMPGWSFGGAPGPVGPQGDAGSPGAAGADGKTLRSGNADPTDDLGSDGDFYFNATSGYLLGPKASGTWPTPGFLLKGPSGDPGPVGPVGPSGDRGPGLLTDRGPPTDETGALGDFYIDSQNFVAYGPKASSSPFWNNAASMVGPSGPAGSDSTVPGPTGPSGPQGFSVLSGNGAPAPGLGSDGDLYIDLAGPDLYPAKAGAWSTDPITLAGPAGPEGSASTVPGPPGPRGASLLSGSGAPNNELGASGDVYIDLDSARLFGPKSGDAWPSGFTSLVGPMGPVGPSGTAGQNGTTLRYGNGAPGANSTANDGDFFIDQTNSRLYGPRANGAWSPSFVSLVGPTGAAGDTIVVGSGPPTAGVGSLGDLYLDQDAGNLYGNKTQTGWPSGYTSLVGPAGAAAVLPGDLTGNSLTVAPVSGDAAPTVLKVQSGSGSTVFSSDASGNVAASGALNVSGPSTLSGATALGATLTVASSATVNSLSVTNGATVGGSVTAARFAASSTGSASAPILGVTGAFQGVGTSYTSGVYSGTFGVWYEMVGGYAARSITYLNGPPSDMGANAVTHTASSGLTGSKAAHQWNVGGGTALVIYGNAAASFGASLGVSGALTASSLSLTSGGLTFSDGSGFSSANALSTSSLSVSGTLTAAEANVSDTLTAKEANVSDTLTAKEANVSDTLTVATANVTAALTAAQATVSGALSAANATVPGTLTAGELVLSSGGALTFADGTSMATAATGSGSGSGGTASGNTFPSGVDITGGGVTFSDGSVQNTAASPLPAMTNFAITWGPSAQFGGQSISTGSQQCYFAGTTIPYAFTPQTSSALMGASITNYAATGAALTVSLNDLTAGTTVVNIGSLATSTTAYSYGFTSTQYPLTAGHQYAWVVQRGTAGVASIQINPQYLMPASTPSALSTFAPFVISTSTTATNGGTVNFAPPGLTGQISYYRNANASYLYYIELYVAGSGTGAPYIFNTTAGANQYAAGNITLTSTLTRYTYGPFSAASWPFVPQSSYRFGLYVPTGGTVTVTQGYANITTGM